MANIIDSNTLFYLRGDSYSDFSSNNIPVTNNGTSIDNSGYVCGKSISFSNNCIRFDKENLIPDTDNFTVEFWINFQTIYNGAGDVFRLNASADNASRYCAVGISNMSGILSWHVTLAGATSWLDLGNIGNPSLNTWIHVAVVREGAYIKCYYNGTYKASSTVDSFELHRGPVNVFGLDTLTTYNTFKMEGLLITKGAKYTANFTPSKEPYTSITISELSYTDEVLNLLVTKSTNEEIHKIEVLVNGVIIKTYNSQTLNFGDTIAVDDYLIYGSNTIEAKAYYLNDNYFVSKSLSVEKSIEKLTNTAAFEDIMNHTNEIKSNISSMNNLLAATLTAKGINTGTDPKMLHLIKLVGQMSNVNNSEITDYLNQISVLSTENSSLNTKLNDIKISLVNTLNKNGANCSNDNSLDDLLEILNSSSIIIGNVKMFGAGSDHLIILKEDGNLYGIGRNSYGQLGLGNTTNQTTFKKISFDTSDLKSIVCGSCNTFLLKNNGDLYAAGGNSTGQLGTGDLTNKTTFIKVASEVSEVSATGFIENDILYGHTVILKNDGTVYGTGYCNHGQLANSNTFNVASFTQIPITNVKKVTLGGNCTYFLKNDSTLHSVGINAGGELGIGNLNTPIRTITQVLTNVKDICSARNACFALKNDGTLWAAGRNTGGILGLGLTISTETRVSTFTQITSGVNGNIDQISCGVYHAFILKNDSVYACGENTYGQLGLGNTINKNLYTLVSTNLNADNVKEIQCGESFTCILKRNKTLLCCGRNNYNQIGPGNTGNKLILDAISFS